MRWIQNNSPTQFHWKFNSRYPISQNKWFRINSFDVEQTLFLFLFMAQIFTWILNVVFEMETQTRISITHSMQIFHSNFVVYHLSSISGYRSFTYKSYKWTNLPFPICDWNNLRFSQCKSIWMGKSINNAFKVLSKWFGFVVRMQNYHKHSNIINIAAIIFRWNSKCKNCL